MKDEHPALTLVRRAERGDPVTIDEVDEVLATMIGSDRSPDLIDSLLEVRWRVSRPR